MAPSCINFGTAPYPRHKKILMSRLTWEQKHGREMKGLALHTCDNPLCINPDHIYEGSHEDNMRDKSYRLRARLILKYGYEDLSELEEMMKVRRNHDLMKPWKIPVKADLAGRVEMVLGDPLTGAPKYGARTKLISDLLEHWLDSVAGKPEPERRPIPSLEELRSL